MCEITKHIEQVKSISSLTESKSSQESEGLSSFNVRKHPSNNTGAFLDFDFSLDSRKLIWKAISSHSHGD